jgi:hypothetical protein
MFAASDWGILPENCVDLETALRQPYRIAALPVLCNLPNIFSYRPEFENFNFSQFDLVLLSAIEPDSLADIQQWAADNNITNYLLAIGAKYDQSVLPNNVVFRPWWAFNIVNRNQYQPTDNADRACLFECLLGARRPNRDFAMLSFSKLNLLEQGIVTYRDLFLGHVIDRETDQYIKQFRKQGVELVYPYLSPNLKPEWEIDIPLSHSISQYVPWKIYQQSYYTVLCETRYLGKDFYISEKSGKALFADRIFVHLGSCEYLKNLRSMGFETFGSVIDESYDLVESNSKRFEQACQQLVELSRQNSRHILEKLRPVVRHNHFRLLELQQQTKRTMQEMLQSNLK